jgi:O-antigen/teichoic acid export membrane protein
LHIAKQSARGSVVLFVGNFIATLFAAASSILVARFLGPPDFGLFSLSLVMPSLLQLFTHFGTRTAVTRYVAYHLSLGEPEKARRFAQAAVLYSLGAGMVFTLVSFFSASWVASTLFQRPELQPYIELASFAVFGQSILLTTIAVATGWNAMGQASLANALQAAFKLAVAPTLVLLGFGVGGAVVGHAASMVLGGVMSGSLVYATKIKLTREKFGFFVEDTKEMMRFGFYPFIGNILTGLSTFYVSVLLAIVASNTVIGYYQAATNLIIPASLLSTAIASALYPAFASLHGAKGDTASAFMMSVKYVGYLILPILFFLAAASNELMYLVYGSSFTAGSGYLILLAMAYVPILVGASILPSFFNAVGLTKHTLYATGAAGLILLGGAPLLAVFSGLAVEGLIYALLLSNVALAAVGLFFIHWRRLGVVDWGSSAATFAASILAFGAARILPSFGHPIILLVARLAVFTGVYLTAAPLLGALTPADVDRLDASLKEIALVGVIVAPIAEYEKYLASWANPSEKGRSSG